MPNHQMTVPNQVPSKRPDPVGPVETEVMVLKFPLNKLFCWHGKRHRKIMKSSNGWEAYCGKCYMKHTCIYEFGVER
jgi:hypothetical protein